MRMPLTLAAAADDAYPAAGRATVEGDGDLAADDAAVDHDDAPAAADDAGEDDAYC